ncbi:MAG: ribonuclease III [Lachnospiraceae bacterium]|nr:ribonuclease III [Lachnospiraceae bacterium]
MEETVTLLKQIKDAFACGDKDINAYSPLALAYIGDDVYDTIVRTLVVERANRPANELNKEAVKYVKAEAQSKAIVHILKRGDILSEEEQEIYKRGRNAKSQTSAKNADIQDYRKATGFEALIGYLYLTGRQQRVVEIAAYAIEYLDSEES